MSDEKLRITCSDGAEEWVLALDLEWWGEAKVIVLSTKLDAYYANQRGIFEELGHRVRLAWLMLRGKAYTFEEIILTDPDAVWDAGRWLCEASVKLRGDSR
mgnify:CR=1 FL=1